MEQRIGKPQRLPAIVNEETGLTTIQEKGAMLLASGVRITDAAQRLEISRGTIYRWMGQDAFKRFFNMMKVEVKTYVEGGILKMHDEALAGVKDSIHSDKAGIKFKASTWVLDRINQMQAGE